MYDVWTPSHRNPEVGPFRKNGRSHRDYTATLPQPIREKPGPFIHVEVSAVRMYALSVFPHLCSRLDGFRCVSMTHQNGFLSLLSESGSLLRWWMAQTARSGAWAGEVPNPRTATQGHLGLSAAPPIKPPAHRPTWPVRYRLHLESDSTTLQWSGGVSSVYKHALYKLLWFCLLFVLQNPVMFSLGWPLVVLD